MNALQALYFALPMYVANMAPVLVRGLPFWAGPIDGGLMVRGKRLFGDHKTWRGLFFGVLFAILTGMLQSLLFYNSAFFQELSLFSYDLKNALIVSGLLGFGALAGDAGKSFLKRQMNRPPGSAWPVFDQLDFVVGALLFVSLAFWPGVDVVLILVFLSPMLHIAANVFSYMIGMKEVPW